jgi:hypothetical protein
MSSIFMDGFDHYNEIREKWTVSNVFDQPTFVAGRFGGQALKKQFQNSAGTLSKNLGAQTEIFWGMAFQAPGLPTLESMWRLQDAGGITRCSINIFANGSIQVAAGGQTDTSAASIITTGGAWHYIEVHYTAKNTGGIAEIRVDEAVVASVTGDTTTGAVDDIKFFEFIDDGTNSPRYLYDDFYILNGSGSEMNGYQGDVRVSVLKPKADGGVTTMNPLTGLDNFAMVDETIADGDTTYVESGIIGASDDYVNQTFSDISVTPSTVLAVQVCTMAKKTDVGAINFKNEMVISAARYTDGVVHGATAGAYFTTTYIRDTDPSDSAAWTEAKVDAVGSAFSIVSPP